jgi:hypothetical protein
LLAVASFGNSRGESRAHQPSSERRVHHERLSLGHNQALQVTFDFSPSFAAADRIVDTTRRTVEYFAGWFGPIPTGEITIADGSEPRGDESTHTTVTIAAHWWWPATDAAVERSLIYALSRRYWAGDAAFDSFADGLVLYTATRAIDAVGAARPPDLRPRHTERYFGGFVPYVVRSLVLPRDRRDTRPFVRRHRELPEANAETNEAFHALYSFERHFGWPALSQGLAALSATRGAGLSASRLGSILSQQMGIDVTWYFDEVSRRHSLDYAVAAFSSEPRNDTWFSTRVRIDRIGAMILPTRSLQLVVHFDDGHDVVEWVDGREQSVELEYLSAARAVRASVDPDATLLIDVDRSNNLAIADSRLPRFDTGLVAAWGVWLQNLMLTYAAMA